jgi:hypothetical protein
MDTWLLRTYGRLMNLYRPMPEERGQINYWGKNPDQFNHDPVEQQVEGSLAVYSHPQYRQIHTGIRLKLEEVIGRKLYNTYYYDRAYFDSQALHPHADRDACEISVSVHISTILILNGDSGSRHQILILIKRKLKY